MINSVKLSARTCWETKIKAGKWEESDETKTF